jgi:hypothetical protein
MLDELQKCYVTENTAVETLKKLRDADGFISRSVAIGNALCFRELLHEAVRWISQEKIPHIYGVIHASFKVEIFYFLIELYQSVFIYACFRYSRNCFSTCGEAAQKSIFAALPQNEHKIKDVICSSNIFSFYIQNKLRYLYQVRILFQPEMIITSKTIFIEINLPKKF